MKKLLALILTLCMILPLLGGVSALAEEPITLTIASTGDRTNVFDGEYQKWVFKHIEEDLNIKLKFIQLTSESYAAMLASGDLADIVLNADIDQIREAGLALNVEPYLEEYVPNALKGSAAPTFALFSELQTNGNGIFFLPCGIGYNGVGYANTFNNRGYTVRWDYYKELGCPKITNDDDYLQVLIQMQKNHPVTEDGYTTYLYGSSNFNGYDVAFHTDLSLDYWAKHRYQNNIFSNEVYDGYLDPDHSMAWAAIEWLNKVWRAGKDNGTFDEDLFTITTDEYKVKASRGQYMGLFQGRSELLKESVKKDPDSISGYCNIPDAPSNYYTNVYMLMGNGSKYMGFIYKDSPNWEAALKLYNCMYDPDYMRIAWIGEQGVSWDYDENGVPQMTEFGIQQLKEYSKDSSNKENYFYRCCNDPYSILGLRNNVSHPDGYPLDFYTVSREYAIANTTDNVAKDMCEWYGVELITDAFYAAGNFDFRNDCGEAISTVMNGLDSDQLRVLTSAQEVIESYRGAMITADTEEEFNMLLEHALEEIKDLGEADVFAVYKEQWDKVADLMRVQIFEAQSANGREPYTEEQYTKLPYKK